MAYVRCARSFARAIFIAGAAAAGARAHAADEAADHGGGEPIVVVGQRGDSIEQPPATVESIDAAGIAATVNVINTEDSLRYFPSLLVRKRHIGDTQAPLATRTSGVGASARSLIYADGILLSALIGNNNSIASPRWGMVAPDEIDRIDVLYGPFSAAYPGNSIGAVVNITTRLPDGPTGSINAATSVQRFSEYDTRGTFPAWQLAATAGDRHGAFAWFASVNHVDSDSQPLAFVTVARPPAAGSAGAPAAGAIPDVNRAGAPILVIGAGGFERQRQDNLKLRLALDVAPRLRLGYRGGLFLNDTNAAARTYLSDAAGPVYAGTLNLDGRTVGVLPSAFSNNVYRLDERHWMHALSAESGTGGGFEWRAIATLYDFDKDAQRIPSTALPGVADGGAGSIVRLDGTGWRTADVKARWRPGRAESHDLSFGAHYDRFILRSLRRATADWLDGPPGALVQAARGRTATVALWAQDGIKLGETIALTLGGRYEWWRVSRGFNFSLAPALSVVQPERTSRGFSPKASLRWAPSQQWSVTASAGQAYRFPTVSELYQAIGTGPTITVPDPNLKPERARSEEIAVQWTPRFGHARLSLFNERIADALIAQTAPLVPGSPSLFSYVQNIPKVRTRGIELAFEIDPAASLSLSGSVTLADPKVIADAAFPAAEGKDLPQVPRRRATLVATWRTPGGASLTGAMRYASRSFATIDNSDPVAHTYQGFESYLVFDARAVVPVGAHWQAAVGVENIGNDRYYLFHPFPQRSFTAELTWRW